MTTKRLKWGGIISWKVEHQGTVWGQPCDMLWKLQNSSYTVWVLRIYISYSYVTTTNNMLFAVSWWQSAWNARRCAGGYTLQHNIVKILQRGYLKLKRRQLKEFHNDGPTSLWVYVLTSKLKNHTVTVLPNRNLNCSKKRKVSTVWGPSLVNAGINPL